MQLDRLTVLTTSNILTTLCYGMCLLISPSKLWYRAVFIERIITYLFKNQFLITFDLIVCYLNLVYKQFISTQLHQPMGFSAVNLLRLVVEQNSQNNNQSP